LLTQVLTRAKEQNKTSATLEKIVSSVVEMRTKAE